MADASIDYVLDANVVMSMLISGRSHYRRIFKSFNLYSTNFLYVELQKYQELIRQRQKTDDGRFHEFAVSLFRNLCVLPELTIAEEAWQKARFYCEDIDPKDIPYVALSISLNYPLLTRDKPLYIGLKKKSFRSVLLFNEFLALQ